MILLFMLCFPCRYLVNLGCIKPLCDLLTVMDSKIVQVALNGLENILRLGEQEAKQENNGSGVNPYCSLIEEAYGTANSLMGWANPVHDGRIQAWFCCHLFYLAAPFSW